MKTIFNVYVSMQNQDQCDRMKQFCIDNGLVISNYTNSFEFFNDKKVMYFRASLFSRNFFVSNFDYGQEVTEAEFMNLLKEYKKEENYTDVLIDGAKWQKEQIDCEQQELLNRYNDVVNLLNYLRPIYREDSEPYLRYEEQRQQFLKTL